MNDSDNRYCGAKTRGGGPCKRAPRLNGRCNLHGGKSLTGIAVPHFKHGRYSRYLPENLLPNYQKAQQDEELLSMRDDVALLDVRIADVLLKVEQGESGKLWIRLMRAWRDVKSEDPTKRAKGLHDVDLLIRQGSGDQAAWAEVESLLQQRRKLVESEHKRLMDLEQMIPAAQVLVLMRTLADTVKQYVKDPALLQAISNDFLRTTKMLNGASNDPVHDRLN